MNIKEFNRKIFIFKLFFVLSRILLFTPIFMVFYLDKGLSVDNVTLLKAITFFTVIIFEVPSGILADSVSKKFVIIISLIFFLLSCIINSLTTYFSLFCIASFLWGAGMAFISGADYSWLYDFLEASDKEGEFSKITGNLSFWNQIITAVCLGISSLFFSININIPYLANGLIFLAAIIFALRLENDNLNKLKISKEAISVKNYISEIKKAIELIFGNKNIVTVFLYTVVFMAFTIFIFDTYQICLKNIGLNVRYYGIVYLVFIVLSGFASKKVYILEKYIVNRLKFLFHLTLMQGVLTIVLFFASKSLVIIILTFIMQEILFGVFMVYSNTTLNRHIDSSQRTTIMSFSSLFTNLIKCFIFPIGGVLIDKIMLLNTYLIFGSLILFIALIVRVTNKVKYTTNENRIILDMEVEK